MKGEIIVYQSKSSDPKYDDVQHLPLRSGLDDDPWAGEGFYFWESHIQLAKWWGMAHWGNKYVLAKAKIDSSPSCLDLHNNSEHQLMMTESYYCLCKKYPDTIKTFAAAIEFLKSSGQFTYDAIRFSVVNSQGGANRNAKFIARILACKPKANMPEQYVDLRPPIQICLITDKSLNLRDYEVIPAPKKRA